MFKVLSVTESFIFINSKIVKSKPLNIKKAYKIRFLLPKKNRETLLIRKNHTIQLAIEEKKHEKIIPNTCKDGDCKIVKSNNIDK